MVDRHDKIKAGSSLKNYWRVLRMHMLDRFGRRFTEEESGDIRDVRHSNLICLFRLR